MLLKIRMISLNSVSKYIPLLKQLQEINRNVKLIKIMMIIFFIFRKVHKYLLFQKMRHQALIRLVS